MPAAPATHAHTFTGAGSINRGSSNTLSEYSSAGRDKGTRNPAKSTLPGSSTDCRRTVPGRCWLSRIKAISSFG